ncbi:hypothetical protein E4U50_007827 [Claviceps purpurea]|nr:hypothetical protein E4U50_007827 [Claviceps purpurea]
MSRMPNSLDTRRSPTSYLLARIAALEVERSNSQQPRNSGEQMAFADEAEAFRAPRPKGTVTKAVFSKGYSGNGMMYPNYNDKPKARVEKSGFFAGETSKCDSWLNAFADQDQWQSRFLGTSLRLVTVVRVNHLVACMNFFFDNSFGGCDTGLDTTLRAVCSRLLRGLLLIIGSFGYEVGDRGVISISYVVVVHWFD